MSDPPRSRGRAKGRIAGKVASVAERRPPPQEVPPQGATAAVASTSGPTSLQPPGGRRNHRGIPRTETDVPDISKLSIAPKEGGGDGPKEVGVGRGSSRRREDYALDNTRPPNLTDKKGVSGESIKIAANYFELLSRPAWAIQQYHVNFAPVVESSFMRRGLLSAHSEKLGSCFIFDGMSDLKTIKVLDELELFTQRRTDGENIRITLKHVGELGPSHPELGHLFNTQMRRNLQHLKFQLLGRHYFDRLAISEVPQYRLQIWQGVVTSIRQQEEKLMMVVDTVHKVVRKETALDVIKGIVKNFPNSYGEECAKELVGCIVMTMYNNHTYRIEDLNWELNPMSTFKNKKDEDVVYRNYYQQQYDIKIQDMKQPLMLCTSKEKTFNKSGDRANKKIYLVPELCCMTGLTDSMRSNYNMMKDLAKQTKLDPGLRARNLHTFIKRINTNPEIVTEMKGWGLKFSDNLVRLAGRVLPAEDIIQYNARYGYDQKTADFSREMRGKSMHVAKNLDRWLIICPTRDGEICKQFLNAINRVCPPMGMQVRNPEIAYIQGDRVANYIQTLKDYSRSNISIVVFIVPNQKKDRYDALKKNTCIDMPIPSQVIVTRTLSKPKMLMSVATKIGIQLNCKLGGEPWALDIPLKAGVMIIGYDAYHDSSKKGQSAGAFVASLNQTFTRWFSKVRFHQVGAWQELSDHLRVNLTGALRKYHEVNKQLPNMILFYRDGVGDGQIRYVKQWEVDQFEKTIKDCIPDACKDGKPRCAFIVVNKQINSRFFHETKPENYMNPPPGTIVDSVITRSDRYDFFLVSQSVREGTVAPTMYNIICDHSGLRPEHQQRLAYKLSHLYFNWPGTIRVPAPCQYAHKLAFLAGQSLHREPAEQLSDTLFYL